MTFSTIYCIGMLVTATAIIQLMGYMMWREAMRGQGPIADLLRDESVKFIHIFTAAVLFFPIFWMIYLTRD